MPYIVHAAYNDFKHGWSEYGQLVEQLEFDIFYSIGSRHTQSAKKYYLKM